MKITKNMRYKNTVESRELYLYTNNNAKVYEMYIKPLEKAIEKKKEFDINKALQGFYRVACNGSNMYKKDFGYSFSVQDRYTCAIDMIESYIMDNDMDYLLHSNEFKELKGIEQNENI